MVAVIMIVVMMVIPLPPLLLDVLIMINISLAMTILLVAMNTKEALQFSIFPTLLLLTTLFRLGLNVSTTRSILTNQTGGRSEEHTSELQSRENLVCRLLLEKKKKENT